jgi:hypothetical protein
MTSPCLPVEGAEVDVVATMASALLEKFGDDAIAVAMNQIAAAGTDPAPVWSHVLARLQRLEGNIRP